MKTVFLILALSLIGAICLAADPNAPIATQDYKAPIRLACVGDSITFGMTLAHPALESYPAQLATMLGQKWEVQNFGYSGATLLNEGDKPYQKQKTFPKALSFNPDVVIIMLGTNDSKPENWRFKEKFAADYRDLIEKFKALASKPRIFICHPAFVPGEGKYGITDAVVQEEIPVIDAVAKEENVGVIDMHGALVGKGELLPDNVHPNAGGANVLAKTAFKALTGKEFTGDAAADPPP